MGRYDKQRFIHTLLDDDFDATTTFRYGRKNTKADCIEVVIKQNAVSNVSFFGIEREKEKKDLLTFMPSMFKVHYIWKWMQSKYNEAQCAIYAAKDEAL